MYVVLKGPERVCVGFPFKYHLQVNAVSGAMLLWRHTAQGCCTIPGCFLHDSYRVTLATLHVVELILD